MAADQPSSWNKFVNLLFWHGTAILPRHAESNKLDSISYQLWYYFILILHHFVIQLWFSSGIASSGFADTGSFWYMYMGIAPVDSCGLVAESKALSSKKVAYRFRSFWQAAKNNVTVIICIVISGPVCKAGMVNSG